MLPSNSQKKNLIQAMKKLTYQISNNPPRQKQIFDSLASNDLIKIVQNLYDDNQYLRRISALLLCQLFYKHHELKIAMIEKLCLPQSYGRICLNRIPDSVQKSPSDIRKCLELMKSPLKKGENDMFCWAINLDKKHLDLELYQFKKYSSFTFLDPQRTIFGFTIIDSEYEHSIPQSPATTSLNTTLKTQRTQRTQRRQYSQQSKLQSQIGKRYSISKRIQTSGLAIRPTTSLTSRQKQYILSSSKQKTYTFLKQPQQSTHTSTILTSPQTTYQPQPQIQTTNKSKLGTSIQSISQYARNSYGRQTERLRQKQKERYSLSFANNNGFQSTQIHTDRFETKRSSQLESSVGKIRSSSKTPQNHHENFYKRVQEILRK